MHEDGDNQLDDDEQVTKKYQCNLCYKQLSSYDNLYDHVRMTHEECFTGIMIEAAAQMLTNRMCLVLAMSHIPMVGSLVIV